MKNPEMKVVRFECKDVIATSTALGFVASNFDDGVNKNGLLTFSDGSSFAMTSAWTGYSTEPGSEFASLNAIMSQKFGEGAVWYTVNGEPNSSVFNYINSDAFDTECSIPFNGTYKFVNKNFVKQ